MNTDEVKQYMRKSFEERTGMHWDCEEYRFFIQGFDVAFALIQGEVLEN